MQLTFKEAKANFFDRQVVTDAVEDGSRKVLSQLAAYARTTARRSIRKARKLKVSEMSPEMREKYGPKRDSATGRFTSQGTKSSGGGSSKTELFKSSDPGEPPRSRSGRLKAGILYAFDPSTLSAVAGAVRFSASSAPQVLEEGGQSQVTIVETSKRPRRAATEKQKEGLAKARAAGKLRRRKGKASKVKRSVQIAARPYMAPALEVVKPKIPAKFKNLIKK